MRGDDGVGGSGGVCESGNLRVGGGGMFESGFLIDRRQKFEFGGGFW